MSPPEALAVSSTSLPFQSSIITIPLVRSPLVSTVEDIFTVSPPAVALSSILIPVPSSNAFTVLLSSRIETLGGLALSSVASVEEIAVK